MNNINTFGICPCCSSEFDVKTATPIYNTKIPNTNITLVCGLCPICTKKYFVSSPKNQQRMGKKGIMKILESMGQDWSIIDNVSFSVHNGNFFNAWWWGHGFPDYIFEGICDGSIDGVVIFPNKSGGRYE